MDDLQHLKARRRAAKSSVSKLLSKVDSVLSMEIEGVNSQSVKEKTKLMANSTLRQLQAKQSQFITFNDSIATKFDDETALEEEIATANAYQFDLDDCITFLTEFLKRADQAPVVSTVAHLIPPTSPLSTGTSAMNSNAHTEAHTVMDIHANSLPEVRTADDPVSKPPIVNSMQHNVS